MKKLFLVPIREENHLSVSALALVKGGGASSNPSCGEDNCSNNYGGSCNVNNCSGNNKSCLENRCTSNYEGIICRDCDADTHYPIG